MLFHNTIRYNINRIIIESDFLKYFKTKRNITPSKLDNQFNAITNARIDNNLTEIQKHQKEYFNTLKNNTKDRIKSVLRDIKDRYYTYDVKNNEKHYMKMLKIIKTGTTDIGEYTFNSTARNSSTKDFIQYSTTPEKQAHRSKYVKQLFGTSSTSNEDKKTYNELLININESIQKHKSDPIKYPMELLITKPRIKKYLAGKNKRAAIPHGWLINWSIIKQINIWYNVCHFYEINFNIPTIIYENTLISIPKPGKKNNEQNQRFIHLENVIIQIFDFCIYGFF